MFFDRMRGDQRGSSSCRSDVPQYHAERLEKLDWAYRLNQISIQHCRLGVFGLAALADGGQHDHFCLAEVGIRRHLLSHLQPVLPWHTPIQ
jgi:hypothetical protein